MEFPVLSGPLCARCGDSLAAPLLSPASALCRPCRMAPPSFERAVAYGPYEGRMKAAIHALKYDRLHAAARGLGRASQRGVLPKAVPVLVGGVGVGLIGSGVFVTDRSAGSHPTWPPTQRPRP